MPRCAIEKYDLRALRDGDWYSPMAALRRGVAPKSGRSHKTLKMTAMHARHGPARPRVRSWLASFLIELIFR